MRPLRFRATALACSLAACAPRTPPTPTPPRAARPALRSERVAQAASLEFHSAFWANLHHVLYAAAWARRGVAPMRSRAGPLPEPLDAALAPSERAAWERAVDYYDRELAARDLLFDSTMSAIQAALRGAADSSGPPTGLAPAHAAVLAAAAPVYRAHWWHAHDRTNRAWIADTVPRVLALSPAVPDRLARLFGTPWLTAPTRVDVVFVANRQGAYTRVREAWAQITVSSTSARGQRWAAAEIVFHEASHALVAPVEAAFDRETRAAGKALPGLWHVALFYLTGEVVRQALGARGEQYTPYLYATGLFDRAWPHLRAPLETHWRPYVDGEVSLDAAVAAVVAACPPDAP